MIVICILLCVSGTKVAHTAVHSGPGRECSDQEINVVSFVNPDSEIGSVKKRLDDVQSFAVLTNDPGAELPYSFTICSDIMKVFSIRENCLMFFNLLRSNGEQLLPAAMFGKYLQTINVANGQIPIVFPNPFFSPYLLHFKLKVFLGQGPKA